MKNVFRLCLSLFVICLVAAFCLGYANSVTKDQIAKNNIEKQNKILSGLFEDCNEFSSLEPSVIDSAAKEKEIDRDRVEDVFCCAASGEIKGYVVKYNAKGFGGSIVLFAGFDVSGKTVGVKILSHTETPGLGAKTADEEFINQFSEKGDLESYALVKGASGDEEISAVSGATISSKAVTNGVNACKSLSVCIIEKEQTK